MARRRIEPAKPLKRKVATRKPKKTLLIFCEGQRTEPEYLEALKRESLVGTWPPSTSGSRRDTVGQCLSRS